MKDRTGAAAGRWVALGFSLALLLALAAGWSARVEASLLGGSGELLQYRVRLAGSDADHLEVLLPPGFEYVGLARGSQVLSEPQVSEQGRRLMWRGPFSGAEVLLFWIAPSGPVASPASLRVSGVSGEAELVEPEVHPAARPEEPLAGSLAGTVTVTKTVEPEVLLPGDSRWLPTYEVIFTNSGPQVVTLDWVTDTLPIGFLFGGMAFGSEVGEPVDGEEPEIVWQGLAVPANGTLTMRYRVRAVYVGGEYQNSVLARAGDEVVGPVSSTLRVEANQIFVPLSLLEYIPPTPVWQLTKAADPALVEPGDPVIYTVVIANQGNRAGTLTKIEDTLPADFAFLGMAPGSDITAPPSGTTGVIYWLGSWEVLPGEELTLAYEVESGGGGNKVNTARAYDLTNALAAEGSSTIIVGGASLPFEDDFTFGVSDDWEPFLNWPGLDPGYWEWSGEVGSWGLMNYDYAPDDLPEYTGYNLFIYNAPGAQGWTDYRIEARIKDSKGVDATSGLTGVWFRGTYEDSGLFDGKAVGGYYVYMKQADEHLYLFRTPPDNPSFAAQELVASYAWAPGILTHKWYKLAIEVEGPRIQVWFEYDEDGISDPVKVFDYTEPAGAWTSGTVGLAVFRTIARFDSIYVLPLD